MGLALSLSTLRPLPALPTRLRSEGAKYAGGWPDELMMRLVDAMMVIPSRLFALLIITVLGASGVNAVIAIGIAFAGATGVRSATRRAEHHSRERGSAVQPTGRRNCHARGIPGARPSVTIRKL